jgi:hypothetical protein
MYGGAMKMKDILFRLLVAAALTLAALALSSWAHGQQAYEDTASTNLRPQGHTQSSASSSETQSVPSNAQTSPTDQTQDELAFTGHIEPEKGALVLKDPITQLSYQLDDQTRARKYVGKQVKIKGKLDLKSNTIQINSIDLIP